jgi:predicted site-specific integrase-resolvase
MLLDSVRPETWYSVKEAAAIAGLSRDSIIRQIHAGFLKAFILPRKRSRRRIYNVYRILGAELIRWFERGVSARQAS